MHRNSPSIIINAPQPKLKEIDIFCDNNRVNWSNFNAVTLRFSKKFDHPFSHVSIFGNMFPNSHGFVDMPVTSRSKIHVPLYTYLISEGRRNCSSM